MHKSAVCLERMLHLHAGAGLALNAIGGLLKKGDERNAAGLAFGKRHGGLNLRQHGAGGKLLFVDVLARLVRRESVKALLVGLAEVDGDLFNGRQDDEHIRVEELGELGGGKVLINDGGRADKLAVTAHDGDATASDRDDDRTVVDERLDSVLFNDVDRLGGGNDLTVATAGILDHGVAFFGGDAVGGLLVVERADGLGGVLEGGVSLIDEHLRDDGGNVLVHLAGGKLVADGVLQVVTDVALAHRAALGEGHVGLDGPCLGGGGHAEVDHADLWAVAVGDDDLVALRDQVDDGLCGLGDKGKLLIGGAAQRVAAEGDDDSLAHDDDFSFDFLKNSLLS